MAASVRLNPSAMDNLANASRYSIDRADCLEGDF